MAEMYNWDKSLREDKSRRNTQNPSFSSSLLDEIYRSIDEGDEKFGEFKLRKAQKVAKKQSLKSGSGAGGEGEGGGRGRLKSNGAVEDEEIASFRRACLVDKWMEMKGNQKVMSDRHEPPTLPEFDWKLAVDNDPLFFSSGSSSSDSSFGWHSESEMVKSKHFESEVVKPKHSCFGPINNRPKQVKTCVSSRSDVKKQNECYSFDDDQTDKTNNGGLIRSKTRALKIYTSLKKVKQPISPGGRLTTFLNAIFTNGHTKKTKDLGFEDRSQTKSKRKTKSTNVSTCSSASSFSRSCLSKNTPILRDHLNNGIRRTVRFLDDEDSYSYIEKKICNQKDFMTIPPTFTRARTEKHEFKELPTKFDYKKFAIDDDEEEDEDDIASDSSSDLFELDHLAIFKNEKYCEELPVYETTHLCTNRAIASGLIC